MKERKGEARNFAFPRRKYDRAKAAAAVRSDLRGTCSTREEARPDVKFAEDTLKSGGRRLYKRVHLDPLLLLASPTVYLYLIIIYVDSDIQLPMCAPCCTISKQRRPMCALPTSDDRDLRKRDRSRRGWSASIGGRAWPRGLLESDAAASWIPKYYQRARVHRSRRVGP